MSACSSPPARDQQDYVDYSPSRLFAAVYPEAVTLAPLIASPYWRRLAGGTEDEQARLFAEAAGRVTYPYSPPDRSGDATAHRALAGSWHPLRCGSAASAETKAARSSSTAISNQTSFVTASLSNVKWEGVPSGTARAPTSR
ncbi:hypothetical protein [Streptomyces sp. NPDC056337]|uniref:hypothetical protein n=1 Tax=Streptomyces sp. NPDC056337 TaxID=3345787 RepID=UPI0035DE8961